MAGASPDSAGRCSVRPVPTLVFVYGTLKRGFPNHDLLRRARAAGEARTRERFPLAVVGSWFVPALLDRPGEGHCVRGELYAVDPPTLAALDELEGVGEPDGYDRRRIEVEREPDGETLTAEVYFKREPLGAVHTGWLEEYRDTRYVGRGER